MGRPADVGWSWRAIVVVPSMRLTAGCPSRYLSTYSLKSRRFTTRLSFFISSATYPSATSESSSSSERKRTLFTSISTDRFTRRAPKSRMRSQFWNDPVISEYVGMVVTVLSQLRTLMVFNPIDTTSPSASNAGATIQSPSCNILFAESCMPATNPSIVSLNTSESIAAEAPSPAITASGSRLIRIARHTNDPSTITSSFTIWYTPCTGYVSNLPSCFRCDATPRNTAHTTRITVMHRYTSLILMSHDTHPAWADMSLSTYMNNSGGTMRHTELRAASLSRSSSHVVGVCSTRRRTITISSHLTR